MGGGSKKDARIAHSPCIMRSKKGDGGGGETRSSFFWFYNGEKGGGVRRGLNFLTQYLNSSKYEEKRHIFQKDYDFYKMAQLGLGSWTAKVAQLGGGSWTA